MVKKRAGIDTTRLLVVLEAGLAMTTGWLVILTMVSFRLSLF